MATPNFVPKPKIVIELDSHQLSAFQSCPRLYYLHYMRHKEAPVDKLAFSKGTAFHDLLFNYYKGKIAGKDFRTCVVEALELSKETLAKLPANDQLLITRKYFEYCDYYRREPIVPIGAEVGFSKVFYEDKSFLFSYQGKIDLVIELERSRLSWVDHKTQARKQDLIAERNQFLGYSWAMGYGTGLINYLGLQESYKPVDSFRRSICTYKQEIIKEWYENTLQTFFQIASLQQEIKNFSKNRTACEGKYSTCEFLRVCAETKPIIINGILEAEYRESTPWSPWEL